MRWTIILRCALQLECYRFAFPLLWSMYTTTKQCRCFMSSVELLVILFSNIFQAKTVGNKSKISHVIVNPAFTYTK